MNMERKDPIIVPLPALKIKLNSLMSGYMNLTSTNNSNLGTHINSETLSRKQKQTTGL